MGGLLHLIDLFLVPQISCALFFYGFERFF